MKKSLLLLLVITSMASISAKPENIFKCLTFGCLKEFMLKRNFKTTPFTVPGPEQAELVNRSDRNLPVTTTTDPSKNSLLSYREPQLLEVQPAKISLVDLEIPHTPRRARQYPNRIFTWSDEHIKNVHELRHHTQITEKLCRAGLL